MTATTNQNRAVAEHCQEEGTPVVQIIFGTDGAKMMTYSLLQSRDECHHFIPFVGDFYKVGFSLRLQSMINFPHYVLTRDHLVRNTNVKWVEAIQVDRILEPSQADHWEFSVYSATRFLQDDYISVAILNNAPHEFVLSGAYVPERYIIASDKFVPTTEIYKFNARFRLLPNRQWSVYDVVTPEVTHR